MPTHDSSADRGPTLAERTDTDAEQALAAYWTDFVEGGRRVTYLLKNLPRTWSAFRTIRALPVVEADPTDTPGGREVRRVITARASYGMPARFLGTAILEVPADGAQYLLGRRAQTLRRKIRSAERQGLTVRPVTDQAERQSLVAATHEAERNHPDPAYRVASPSNTDLLDHDLWITVENAEGETLMVGVAPYDGEFAILRYFRTLGAGDAYSDARYLASGALVAELADRGVRYLLDTATPPEQTNGLRHFQRMVGFRYARVRLRRSR